MGNKMMMIAASVMVLFAAAMTVSAHHSFSAEFDERKPVTLKGTITKMDWINPHGWLYIDVKTADGKVRVLTLDSPKSPASKTGLRDFDVEALVDGDWRTVAEVRGNTTGTVERTFDPVRATALRVVVQDSNDHNYSRVIELEGYSG